MTTVCYVCKKSYSYFDNLNLKVCKVCRFHCFFQSINDIDNGYMTDDSFEYY